jgi:hypothetical protein
MEIPWRRADPTPIGRRRRKPSNHNHVLIHGNRVRAAAAYDRLKPRAASQKNADPTQVPQVSTARAYSL